MTRTWGPALLAALVLSSCANTNDIAMRLGSPDALKTAAASQASMPAELSTVERRALQSRRFDTDEEARVMIAATQVLQDLGYTITESSSNAGVLVASKQRDATESGQVAGAVTLTIAAALLGVHVQPTWDTEQTIFVTLVTTPIENAKQVEVRVSFDRRMTNNYGQQWRAEVLMEAGIYQEFFDKLSQSVFLEALTS